ncbi:hypothetical protein NM208_g9272 [Fusarium decemcellulare]|uniref:Uncharacterized protein n=1 Tax=Fusarium decemcellulare TaxID=57161 RepID=A0ACC1S2D2_9HYPO|nr:hypothetical protein NM208_g9272 [Fusarium decemcellulare]
MLVTKILAFSFAALVAAAAALISTEQLAANLGVSPSDLSKLLSATDVSSLDITKYTKALEVNPEELASWPESLKISTLEKLQDRVQTLVDSNPDGRTRRSIKRQESNREKVQKEVDDRIAQYRSEHESDHGRRLAGWLAGWLPGLDSTGQVGCNIGAPAFFLTPEMPPVARLASCEDGQTEREKKATASGSWWWWWQVPKCASSQHQISHPILQSPLCLPHKPRTWLSKFSALASSGQKFPCRASLGIGMTASSHRANKTQRTIHRLSAIHSQGFPAAPAVLHLEVSSRCSIRTSFQARFLGAERFAFCGPDEPRSKCRALRSATTPPRTPLAYLYHFSPATANSKILEEEAPQCPSMAYDNKHRVEQPAPHLARISISASSVLEAL